MEPTSAQPTEAIDRVAQPVLIVTLLTLTAQIANVALQITTAYLFGAGADMDAFLAANSLPLYLNVALLGSLGFVFVPVFVQHMTTQREADAWQIAGSVSVLCVLGLGCVAALGMLFADAILELAAPGLSPQTHSLAVRLSWILWPSVPASGMALLLTSIYHSLVRFTWPAAVPFIGTITSLILTLLLFGRYGILSLAISATIGSFLQILLLLPVAFQGGRLQLLVNLRHPGVGQVLRLLVPLVLASMVGKATTVVERYFASSLAAGSISHLNYALRVVTLLSVFISSGISVVIFQRMSMHAAGEEKERLRRTISAGVRYLWLIAAPLMALSSALALPAVIIGLQHGQFGPTDSMAVASLMRVYLLSLAAGALGNIMARGFYVLQDTRTLGVMSGLEALAYVVYTALLVRYFGVLGVAVGYVILFNGSLIWQALILRRKTGASGRSLIPSMLQTASSAILAGGVAWGVASNLHSSLAQLFWGGLAGLAVYVACLLLLRSPELHALLTYGLRALPRAR